MLGFGACCVFGDGERIRVVYCIDLPLCGLLLRICRIQMPLSRVVIRIIMEMIYDNNNDRDDAACRIGHTAVRLGGLAAVVKDARRVGLHSGVLPLALVARIVVMDVHFGTSGRVSVKLDPWAAVMICDGDVVAEIDVADETASPGLQRWSKREHLSSINLSARARGLLHCFCRDVFMLQSCTGRYHPTCCKDKDSNPIIRLEKRVAM